MTYRADIDALRGVAVLLVCLFHLFPQQFPNGFLGVDIFFAISGYLITSILISKQGSFFKEIGDFYSKRIRRLFPALLTVMATSLIIGWFLLFPEEFQQLCLHILRASVYWMNYTLYSEVGYFDAEALHKPLLHLWSLSVEEHFYIIWPLIILSLREYKQPLLIVVSLICALSLGWFLYIFQSDGNLAFYSSITRFWELSAGGILALCLQNKPTPPKLFSILGWGALFLVIFWRSADVFSPYKLILCVIATCGILSAPIFFRLQTPLKLIGLISYPLYLWHYVLISFGVILFNFELSFWVSSSILAISVIFASITTLVVEPLRYKKSSLFPLIGIAAIIAAIGYSGNKNNGFSNRPHMQYLQDQLVQLERTPKIDQNCISLVNSLLDENAKFDYCRATSTFLPNKNYVLLIGDSHAHALYPGIAHYAAKYGYETLLMANSSCPPFPGFPWGKDFKDKEICQTKIDQMLRLAASQLAISKAIITTRGPIYIHGKIQGDYTEKKIIENLQIQTSPDRTYTKFFNGYTSLVKALKIANIPSVFYMLENPELDFYPKQTIIRPFINFMINEQISKDLYLLRMQKYRFLFAKDDETGVIFLDPMDVLCQTNSCKYFDHNYLYRDDDHFSVYGSHFIIEYFENEIFGNRK